MSILSRRVAKLESLRVGSGAIPVWCDDPADMAATIAGMIEAGEITQADICRCVHWTHARDGARSIPHEDTLASLDAA